MFGIIFTICQGKIIDRFNTLAGNIFLCVFLLIGTVMTGKAATVVASSRVGCCYCCRAKAKKFSSSAAVSVAS